MSEVYKHLSNIYAMDRATLGVICALCVMSSYFVKEYMANPIMVIFVYPILIVFSVLIHYSFVVAELFPSKKLDQWLMWTIFATICGNMLGLVVVAMIGRVRESMRRPFQRVADPRSRI